MERFAGCPFSFFAEYGLKAEERRLYQLNTPDLGSLFHEVLELFSNKLEQDNLPWTSLTKEETTARIHAAVEDEVGFGAHEALPPIVIRLQDGGSLILNGKIDRVDLLDANGTRYVKIIDYKSGNKTFHFQDIYYGLQLQLLVYLDAYLKYYKKTGASFKPGGVFYFRITDPTLALDEELSAETIEKILYEKMRMSGLLLQEDVLIHGLDHSLAESRSSAIVPVGYTKKGDPTAASNLATEEQYAAILDFVATRTQEIGDAMKAGIITPAPYRDGQRTPCSYCSYRSLCRHSYGEAPRWRKLKKIDKADFWESITPKQPPETE